MASWLNEQLKSFGVATQLTELGTQEIEGQTLPLPPAVLGKIGNDKNKKTILLYGHFDVQPVRRIFGCASKFNFDFERRPSKVMAGILSLSNWSSTKPPDV
jgi:acetylornithine deacetylase/succinyl-diaminopimelate desuccinylase-like protein